MITFHFQRLTKSDLFDLTHSKPNMSDLKWYLDHRSMTDGSKNNHTISYFIGFNIQMNKLSLPLQIDSSKIEITPKSQDIFIYHKIKWL